MGLALKKEKRYTFNDYITWPDDERWEIIDGVAYNMSPAPKVKHQNIVSSLHIKLKTYTSNICYTGIAPTDVVLDDFNVVQPDVFVVCDKNKITEDNIKGTPDLIIEVTSPSTELKDKREKKNLYEKSGVKEYIIVFPEGEYIERYWLKDDKYHVPEILNWDETLKLSLFEIEINLWEIFEKEKKTEKDVT
ncbi:MAG: Uma2 family endonuclease [Nitrospirota bacterium]